MKCWVERTGQIFRIPAELQCAKGGRLERSFELHKADTARSLRYANLIDGKVR
jgi:hypothetical protein